MRVKDTEPYRSVRVAGTRSKGPVSVGSLDSRMFDINAESPCPVINTHKIPIAIVYRRTTALWAAAGFKTAPAGGSSWNKKRRADGLVSSGSLTGE